MDIEGIIREYGYLAIVANTFIEGETIQIIAGWFAHEGILDYRLVILAGFSGTVAGDQLYFWLGRRWGDPLMRRYPKLAARCQPAFKLLRRFDNLFILGFRFVYGVRNMAPFACGAAGISVLRFTVLNVIAALIWATVFASAGFFFGKAIAGVVEEYGLKVVLPTIVGLIFTVWLVRRIRAHRRAKREAAEAGVAEARTTE